MHPNRPRTMPQDEVRTFTRRIADKIRAGDTDPRPRDGLVRLRSMLEEQLGIEPPVIFATTGCEGEYELAA